MAEMSEVVSAMTDRVTVDLAGDDIAQCMQIFNVHSWGDRKQQRMLEPLVQTLSKALKLDARVQPDFVTSAKGLLKVVQAADANRLQISNRLAWSWVLCEEWRAHHMPSFHRLRRPADLATLISFYLAVKVNTTTLERNLGQLCEQIRNHSGPISADGHILAAVLGVALDGPQKESELYEAARAAHSSQVQLLPTEFSKACAKLWLSTHGRRFQYKYSKAAKKNNTAGKPTGIPRKGTFAFVKHQRKIASKTLCQAAHAAQSTSAAASGQAAVASFVDGLELPLLPANASNASSAALQGTRWSSSATSSLPSTSKQKKHPAQLFQEHTARKQARVSYLFSLRH